MAKTINRRLAELIDGSGQLQAGKLPNSFITTDHYSSNSITDAKLHTSFALPASALTARDTGDLSEGSNLYYTTARWDSKLAAADTGDLSEGSNLYYTDARVGTYISGNRTYGNITTTGYIAGPATFTIDPAAVGDNTGTVVIAGNLQVDGTTTTINSTTLEVDDLNITLASGSANSGAANGAGITVDIANNTNPTLLYNGTLDSWDFNKSVRISSADPLTLIAPSNNADFILSEGGTNTDARIRNSNGILEIDADLNNEYGNSSIVFAVDGTDKLKINNNGEFTLSSTGTVTLKAAPLGSTYGAGFNAMTVTGTSSSPYTSTIGFSNYGATDAMVIKGDQVGIGTTNPTFGTLEVQGPKYVLTDSGQARGGIHISPDSSATSGQYGGAISLSGGGSGSAAIASINDGGSDHDSVGIAFITHPQGTGGADAEEKMRITEVGNVGIGTDSPNQNGGAGTFTWASPLQTIAGSRPTLFLNGSSVISTIRMWPRATDGTSTSVDDWHINAINQGSGGYLSIAPQGGAIAPKGLHIKNTGNVGIGTTNPEELLHLTDTGGNAILKFTRNDTTTTSGGTVGAIQFAHKDADNAGVAASIVGKATNAFGKVALTFATGNPTTKTERMRLDAEGNLGIGTNPNYLVHADSDVSTDPSYIVAGSGSNFVMAMGSQNSPGVAQEAFIGTLSNERFKVKVNNVEKATFTSTGLGIGTSAPVTSLSFGEASTGITFLSTATNFNSGKVAGIRGEVGGTGYGNLAFDTFQGGTGGGERMMIRYDGNVGIGDNNPGKKLEVSVGNSNTDGIRITGSSANTSLIINNTGSDGVAWDISSTGSNHGYGVGALHFGVGFGTPKMKITSAGQVGIGTNNPSANLDVVGGGSSVAPTLELNSTTSTSFNHAINAYNSNLTDGEGNLIVVGKEGSTKNAGWLGYRYSANGSDNNVISLGHWGNNWLFNVMGNGNVGIGEISALAKLDILGNVRVQAGNVWSESNQGQATGSIHIDPNSATDHAGGSITFGASDTSNGQNSHAGIYVRSDGSYGTKMYLSTTDSYGQGSKTAMMIDNVGNVGIGPTNPTAKLHVQTTTQTDTSVAQLELANTVNANPSHINQKFSSGAGWIAMVQAEQRAAGQYGALNFWTANNANPTQAMTLNYNGDLAVGEAGVQDAPHPKHKIVEVTSSTNSNSWSTAAGNNGGYDVSNDDAGSSSNRGSISAAGYYNHHVAQFSLRGNFSANTWYPFTTRDQLQNWIPGSASSATTGMPMYFRIYTYDVSAGGGDYLSHRLTDRFWFTTYGSNSNQRHQIPIGPAMGHAPNSGAYTDHKDYGNNPIQIAINHRYGADSHYPASQTFEIWFNSARTGLTGGSAVAVEIFAYIG